MANTTRAKLVTIIAAAEYRDRIQDELMAFGASGYTVYRVDGRGHNGPRVRGVFEIGNIRFEAIVSPSTAEALLALLDRQAEQLDVVAFVQDVDALPKQHFV